MALVLNEEQVMLRDAAAGFLAEKATVANLRELRDEKNEQGFSSEVWAEIAQMGWAGIAIPEEFGGLGYGYTGLGLVLEQAGRVRNRRSSYCPLSRPVKNWLAWRCRRAAITRRCRLQLLRSAMVQTT